METISVSDNLTAELDTFGPRPIDRRLAIMTYEMGNIARWYVNGEAVEADRNAYFANILVEIGDLICQARMLHADILAAAPSMKHRPSFEETVNDGYAHQLERMADLKEKRK